MIGEGITESGPESIYYKKDRIIEPGLELIHYKNFGRDGEKIRTLRLYDDGFISCSEISDGSTRRYCDRLEHGHIAHILVEIVDSGVFDLDEIYVDSFRPHSGDSTELYVKFNGREKTIHMFNKRPDEERFVNALTRLEELAERLMN